MENMNIDVNYEVVNYEKEKNELEIQQREIDKKRNELIDKRLAKLENNNKIIADVLIKQQKENEIITNKISELVDENAKIKSDSEKIISMTFVLKNDNDGKLESFKKKCHARVKLIVGKDKSGYKYILFYNCYIANIYSSITTSLYGDKCNVGNIKIDDYTMAMELAGRWKPSDYVINNHINTLLSKRDKNKLNVAQEKSLDEYLEEISGGKIA